MLLKYGSANFATFMITKRLPALSHTLCASLVVVVMTIPAYAYALECFACHDIKSKFRCHTTTICNSGEICLVQKVYSSFKGQIGARETSLYYNMACKKREQCTNGYRTGTNFKVKSRYIDSCCCTDRCVEEDGTGYGDYSNCFNALTLDEARQRRGAGVRLQSSSLPCFLIFVMAAFITSCRLRRMLL